MSTRSAFTLLEVMIAPDGSCCGVCNRAGNTGGFVQKPALDQCARAGPDERVIGKSRNA